ncbi:MAG: hypothetical protein CVV51_13000 [Spirochaetae bacterium HGW-Spirochaetae-7]|jgi:hypothetical protein|nr:MAG: hypothetical protein CVV51_13000 [Spirochaetae bacterium HGW-Spirochaetae-7]
MIQGALLRADAYINRSRGQSTPAIGFLEAARHDSCLAEYPDEWWYIVQKSILRRADLLFSVFLALGSLFLLFESIKLFLNPFRRKWEAVPAEGFKETFTFWYKSPAILPLLVSLLLLVCALSLFHVARKSGARIDFLKKDMIMAFLRNAEFRAFVITALLLCVYAFALIPLCRNYLNILRGFRGFPFFVATLVYLLAMMLTFGDRKPSYVFKSFTISILTSGVITYAFGTLAKIPLP